MTTPTVIRTPGGDVVAPVDGCLVRVSGWAELAPPDRWVDPVAIGELMAALHLVRVPPSGPVHTWYAHPVPAACWTQLVDKLRSADAPFAEGVASAVPDLVEITRHTVTVQPIQQCHLDLFADNVRALPDGRLCVIDWDNAGPGDPSQELALALLEYGAHDPVRLRQVHTAYLDAGGPGRVSTVSDFSQTVAQLGHILEKGCQQWLTAETDEDRAWNQTWVQEYLNEPLTLAWLQFVLQAVQPDG